ncbi:MAG: PDZ domain-containing protein [Blastocatellia bacterium]|nr:PDZ domain-containing protein [Blastocatellia bacterium]
MRIVWLLVLVFCASSLVSAQTSSRALFGRLAVNETRIVFTYAGDVWTVDRQGGEARRLTTHPAEDGAPVISPDGKQLAYASQAEGSWDVYLMPIEGGTTRRLTFHPRNEYPRGWTPDGKSLLLLTTETGSPQLSLLDVNATLPTQLPLVEGWTGSFAPDGQRLAVAPTSSIGDWRYYRGGNNGRIWLTDRSTWNITPLAQGTFNDEFPMWVGNTVYFISDRTGVYNLFAYDLGTRKTRQLTTFETYGIRWASAGGEAVAFVRDGRIYLYEIATGKTRTVDIRLNPERPELKPRTASALRSLESISPGMNGETCLIGARGEVLALTTATGAARNLTQTPGVAERYPVLSPDGKQVAFFSDESGEYELQVRELESGQLFKRIPVEAKPSFYRELTWAPDGKRLAFTDKRLALWVAEVASGKTMQVDRSTYSYQEEWFPRWSPDGRWLTFSKHLRNRVRTVFIWEAASGQTRQITDGVTHTEQPCFDANGKYLYFVSSLNAGTSEFGWGVLNGVLARPLITRQLQVAMLSASDLAPFLPDGKPNPAAKPAESVPAVTIDFAGLNRRVLDLPTPARDYAGLQAGLPGTVLVLVNEWPPLPAPGANPSQMLYRHDFSQPGKLDKLAENVGALEVTGDGRRVLLARGGVWSLLPTAPAEKTEERKLDLGKVEIAVDPAAEWKQMYHEAWRIMRDWFYDPAHHGQNLADLEAHYATYLPNVTRRTDLNGLLGLALGHISVSHFVVGGGDMPSGPPPARIGLLGADYEIAAGRYRFKRIFRSSTYSDPLGTNAAPLDRPGVQVKEGEFLLKVEGQDVTADKPIWPYFLLKNPGPLTITVGPEPTGANARTLTVYPIPNETQLRVADWAEANRRRVEEASQGKLGYVYVADYGAETLKLMRALSGYSDRAGIIIDQRYNGGGITPDYLIEWLRRKPIYQYTFREGDDIATPVNPGPPVSVLLVNHQNYSAAETFAFMYKLTKIGPLVGKRTGGGGIGPYVFTPRLLDGGRVQLPNRAAYNPDGTSWGIENIGVAPDVEVEILPQDVLAGRDPQLEQALRMALEAAKKQPPAVVKKPKYPVHK